MFTYLNYASSVFSNDQDSWKDISLGALTEYIICFW